FELEDFSVFDHRFPGCRQTRREARRENSFFDKVLSQSLSCSLSQNMTANQFIKTSQQLLGGKSIIENHILGDHIHFFDGDSLILEKVTGHLKCIISRQSSSSEL